MSNDLPKISKWKIDTIDASTDKEIFPPGTQQTLEHLGGKSYELRWCIRVSEHEYLVRLFPLCKEGNRLANPVAQASLNGKPHGVYDVELDLIREVGGDRIAGRSDFGERLQHSTPGPIVGQWGAESVPTLPEDWETERMPEGSGAAQAVEPAVG